MNFVDKYWWIYDHPKCNPEGKPPIVEIVPVMVNPETNRIEKAAERNTKPRWWVEFMTYETCEMENGVFRLLPHHDWDLDCGGDSYEAAVEALYEKVLNKYGNYGEEENNEDY